MTSRLQRVASSRAARTAFGYAAGAWVLIQVIATVSEPLGWPAYGLRLVIIGVTAGFVVAVPVAAWYDRRERVAAALVAAPDEAPGSASEPILTATPPMPDGPSVAVLAFADMSAARDQDYFCEGTAEEIINALNRVQGLRVAARAGSFQFKHRVVDTRDIGRLLNVRAVLDGSVRKSGDRVRIAAQLIDAQDGAHLWSETFDRQLEDIFAIQDEIARRTVQALRVTLLTADKSRLRVGDAPGNVAAYDHYLRARQLSRKEKDTEQSGRGGPVSTGPAAGSRLRGRPRGARESDRSHGASTRGITSGARAGSATRDRSRIHPRPGFCGHAGRRRPGARDVQAV